jgi:beta-glucosidase
MTGHGQPEGGMNVGPAQISERVLREVFFPPFEAAIQEANAATVMASYNEIDGIPSHASDYLLNDVLRGEWGFTGAVVADYFAINELQARHKLVDNLADAGALSLSSGVDIELPDGVAFYAMADQIESGELDEALIDQAVRRMLLTKARANLWETTVADGEAADAITGNDEARTLARQAAHKATILLENNGVLPLDPNASQTIAVIGPNSAITVLGGYSDEPRQTVSLLDGMREVAGDRIVHAKGVTLTDNRSWWDDEVNLIDPEVNRRSIAEAVEVARAADIIVLAVGGDESTSREAWSETHMGDRDDITLVGEQVELIEALSALDKPMVGVIISGRPLALTNVQDKFDALLYGFLLGQETGGALADVLFGDVSPSGKLPVTLPRSVGQLPSFYNHKPTSRRGYAFSDASPLYPFGFGRSYTTFEMSEPRLTNASIRDTITVTVDVTNTGDRAADEVVQIYVRDDVATVTRRVKELKGFQRVTLAPGETQTVSIDLGPDAFSFYNRDMERVVEPGTFTIMAGPDSENIQSTTLTLSE